MSIIENSRDEIYELAYYTIPNSANGNLVHKKINMKVERDILGNPINTKVYGSWRKFGFWTDKDFETEKPIESLINQIDMLFNVDIIANDQKYFEAKQKMVKLIESTFKDKMIPEMNVKLLQHIPYGADHNNVLVSEPPRQVV